MARKKRDPKPSMIEVGRAIEVINDRRKNKPSLFAPPDYDLIWAQTIMKELKTWQDTAKQKPQ